MEGQEQVTISQGFSQFLASLREEQHPEAQQEVGRFVRWMGRDLRLGEIKPPDVGEYAEQMMSSSTTDAARRLEHVRAFLSFLHKGKLTRQNLARHVKTRRTSPRSTPLSEGPAVAPIRLTAEGLTQLKAQLEELRGRRTFMSQEIHRAAADKDVRENAPLEAAREAHGHLEARIRELEATLNAAVVLSRDNVEVEQAARRVKLGSRVLLREATASEDLNYLLVSPSESNPLEGKLSAASPVGKALLERRVGEEVEVSTPRGTLRYIITGVE